MELRYHPAVSYHGMRSWPPVWSSTIREQGKRKTLRGEIGTLSTAYMTHITGKVCFIIMEYESESYVGALMLQDASFCRSLCALLKANAGRPIAEIGSIDLSGTL